ncbi:hypothetical protein JW756_04655 [Candidatus Woesearchaeota archaeon]|nr:hypothetical protein [Candidatus Woesearchaeota archaeon]
MKINNANMQKRGIQYYAVIDVRPATSYDTSEKSLIEMIKSDAMLRKLIWQ